MAQEQDSLKLKSILEKTKKEAEERDAERRAAKAGVFYLNLAVQPVETDALELIPEEKAKEAQVAAIEKKGDRVVFAAFDSTAPKAKALIQELEKKETHPLLVIGNFLVEFLKIHPFEDGNGRLSRILTNLLLLRAGYLYIPYISHEQIIERRKDEYYIALRQSQATFDTNEQSIKTWLRFFLGVVEEQSTRAIALLEVEHLEDILSKKQMEVWMYISSVADTSAGEIVKHTDVGRPTVNQVLEKLLRLNKIKRTGQGRAVRYKKI